jgi:ubiquinone/menaquinone biosynthesis C-methylase UbiE
MSDARAANQVDGGANAAMRRYWNEVAGPRWVGRQGVQEARNVEMLAILLDAAAAQSGERVLDVGCGTGVTTQPYAEAVGPTGHVTGIDISQPMLDAARRRIDAAGLKNVTLMLADAQVHEFAPASYDLLTSRLGVMFFADPTAAFRNLIKALRPGGRLCMAVWAAPGPHVFGNRDYLRGILTAAGFADIAIAPRHFHIRGQTAAAMAEHVGLFGAVQRLMDEKGAGEATRRTIVGETEAAFAGYATPDGIRLPATFLLVTARRP